MALCRDMLSGSATVRFIGRQGRADLLVDEGVEADVRALTKAALTLRGVVLPQEIIHLACDEQMEKICIHCLVSTLDQHQFLQYTYNIQFLFFKKILLNYYLRDHIVAVQSKC